MIFIQTRATSPVQKIVATVIGLAVLALGLMFSVVILPVLAIAGLLGLGYLHWKTRSFRKAMARHVDDQHIIEGEAVIVRDESVIQKLR